MRTPFIFFFCLCLALASAQEIKAQNALEGYIAQGIESNVLLQKKNIELQKGLDALKMAKSYYLPTVNYQFAYQSGDGGRSIALPIGDLLNPVYATLNTLTGSSSFPTIENVETNFFPFNFYDTKVRTSIPIYNAEVKYGRDIQGAQNELKEIEIEIYKKELAKEIKVAYFQYLGASKAIEIYESSILLAKQALLVNEKLYANGKLLKAYVVRSETEVKMLEAKKNEASLQAGIAKLYFNFLINASPDQEINKEYPVSAEIAAVNQLLISSPNTDNRLEFKLLQKTESIFAQALSMNQSYWHPRLNAIIDLGSQASNFQVNKKSLYYFVGVQLDVPIFNANRSQLKISQSSFDLKSQQLSTQDYSNKIRLSANIAQNKLKISIENYKAAQEQKKAAEEYNKLIQTGYKEGVSSFIETIDASNQLNIASILENIRLFEILIAKAEYDRQIGN